MTHPADLRDLKRTIHADLRADLKRTITDAAANICEGFRRERIPIEVSLAIVTYVLGLLTDQLPADQRASFLQAFAKDLRRTPRRDA